MPLSVDRQMPPVELPTSTMREFVGETATALMRPLVNPQLPGKKELVGAGPIACQPRAAKGSKFDSSLIFEAAANALRLASAGIESVG